MEWKPTHKLHFPTGKCLLVMLRGADGITYEDHMEHSPPSIWFEDGKWYFYDKEFLGRVETLKK